MAKGKCDKESERVPTGIPGFDELVQGGFERNSFTLLKGGTGTGKTIFSLQFLYNGCSKYEEPGVFISFEESREVLMKTGEKFGWDLQKYEKDGSFAIIRYSPHEIEKIVREGGGTVRDTIDSMGAKRIVVDSLSAYSILFENNYKANEGVLELLETLKGWKCTTVVTDEHAIDIHGDETGRLGFLSDGLICLYYLRKDGGRFRALEILKMRHTRHSDRLSLFDITDRGVIVKPNVGIFGEVKE